MPLDPRASLLEGGVIPAHPLALTSALRLDERRQAALTRYYLDAGAKGIAVGVHTTQFAIHDPAVGLYEPVLSLAAATVDAHERTVESVVRIAGVVGDTRQATSEAVLAQQLGYHVALVSLPDREHRSLAELVDHVRAVCEIMPVMGFYLQPAVGGRDLPGAFWRGLVELDNLVGSGNAHGRRVGARGRHRAVHRKR
jgi:dihydrodipicolinate synthase/N-acetylneuraminate lyase